MSPEHPIPVGMPGETRGDSSSDEPSDDTVSRSRVARVDALAGRMNSSARTQPALHRSRAKGSYVLGEKSSSGARYGLRGGRGGQRMISV
jgi:hypothetical protein